MVHTKRVESLAAVADAAANAETFSFAVRNFLDEFYARPSTEHLAVEPRILVSILNDDGLADAYLAAIAEHLAQRFRLPVPAWTRATWRIVKEPWFAMKTEAGRMFLITDSPAAFRKRNIFVSADAITRA